MDPFAEFNFVLIDASKGPPGKLVDRGTRRERVDLIARQLGQFIREGDQSDTEPHGFSLTPEFKLRRQATASVAWIVFVDDDGPGGARREVAAMVIVREQGPDATAALRRLEPHAALSELPAVPYAVAVALVPQVPGIVREWYTKAAAGFIQVGF